MIRTRGASQYHQHHQYVIVIIINGGSSNNNTPSMRAQTLASLHLVAATDLRLVRKVTTSVKLRIAAATTGHTKASPV